jgi:hypothetical protein
MGVSMIMMMMMISHQMRHGRQEHFYDDDDVTPLLWPALCGAFMVCTMRLPVLALMNYKL